MSLPTEVDLRYTTIILLTFFSRKTKRGELLRIPRIRIAVEQKKHASYCEYHESALLWRKKKAASYCEYHESTLLLRKKNRATYCEYHESALLSRKKRGELLRLPRIRVTVAQKKTSYCEYQESALLLSKKTRRAIANTTNPHCC